MLTSVRLWAPADSAWPARIWPAATAAAVPPGRSVCPAALVVRRSNSAHVTTIVLATPSAHPLRKDCQMLYLFLSIFFRSLPLYHIISIMLSFFTFFSHFSLPLSMFSYLSLSICFALLYFSNWFSFHSFYFALHLSLSLSFFLCLMWPGNFDI